jgi:folate-binding protein YgfZ
MTTNAVVDRSPRGLVVVSGLDATSFLQSLVSQDLDPIADGDGAHSLMLTPQGKLDVEFRILRVGDAWWLDTEADYGPRLAESLTRFRIRVKVEIEDRTSSTGLLSILGASPVDVPKSEYAHVAHGALLAVRTTWEGTPGVDLVGPTAEVAAALETVDPSIVRWDEEEFEAFRIGAGVPRLGIDIDDSLIPQEAFLDQDAVSFTKGCFVGQELVCRIDTRGHVNRYLRRLRIEGDVPPVGATIVDGDKEVGRVTSVASIAAENRTVALAMVRREIEPPTTVDIRWDDGSTTAQVVVASTT